MSSKTLPITEARDSLTDLVNRAANKLDEFVITVNGKPKAVLMSSEEFESWKETIDILSDPELMEDIKRGEEDIKAGRVVSLEELKKDLGV
jgi:antitoxin YefM